MNLVCCRKLKIALLLIGVVLAPATPTYAFFGISEFQNQIASLIEALLKFKMQNQFKPSFYDDSAPDYNYDLNYSEPEFYDDSEKNYNQNWNNQFYNPEGFIGGWGPALQNKRESSTQNLRSNANTQMSYPGSNQKDEYVPYTGFSNLYNTTPYYCEQISSTLQIGDRGENVKKLQAALKALGYYTGPITGFFGQQTMDAVRKFQTANNIIYYGSPETTGFGNVGPRTLKKINELCKNNLQYTKSKNTTVLNKHYKQSNNNQIKYEAGYTFESSGKYDELALCMCSNVITSIQPFITTGSKVELTTLDECKKIYETGLKNSHPDTLSRFKCYWGGKEISINTSKIPMQKTNNSLKHSNNCQIAAPEGFVYEKIIASNKNECKKWCKDKAPLLAVSNGGTVVCKYNGSTLDVYSAGICTVKDGSNYMNTIAQTMKQNKNECLNWCKLYEYASDLVFCEYQPLPKEKNDNPKSETIAVYDRREPCEITYPEGAQIRSFGLGISKAQCLKKCDKYGHYDARLNGGSVVCKYKGKVINRYDTYQYDMYQNTTMDKNIKEEINMESNIDKNTFDIFNWGWNLHPTFQGYGDN